MKITVIKAIAMVITLSFISGCDLLTDSRKNDEPHGNEKDLQQLLSSTWVSIPGQEIAGHMPNTESWYTLGFYRNLSDAESDSIMGGGHYYMYNDDLTSGNHYFAEYIVDDEMNILIVDDAIMETLMVVPVYENFSFGFIDDWYIRDDRLFILYPYTEEDEYILEFEMLTEDHPVAQLFESQWPYQ